MRRNRKGALVSALVLAASMVVATVPAVATEDGGARSYEITVENLTVGQLVTPVVAATHAPSFRLFRTGQAASNGIQQLAENGGVPVLVAELQANSAVGSVGVIGAAPIAPGGSATGTISSDQANARLSLAGMLICSNDGFAGRSSLQLPSGVDQYRTFYVKAYDAGTEMNTEAYADLVPPCDGLGQTGMSNPALAENGVVHPHGGIAGIADLDPAIHGIPHRVLKVTVKRTA